MWFARQFPAYTPNSLLLDNALATMGAGLPSAVAAKIVRPNHHILGIVGDGGYMMASHVRAALSSARPGCCRRQQPALMASRVLVCDVLLSTDARLLLGGLRQLQALLIAHCALTLCV